MYDVMVLAPGGGWATDTTGTLRAVRERARRLAASNRKRVILRVYDRHGRPVTT